MRVHRTGVASALEGQSNHAHALLRTERCKMSKGPFTLVLPNSVLGGFCFVHKWSALLMVGCRELVVSVCVGVPVLDNLSSFCLCRRL